MAAIMLTYNAILIFGFHAKTGLVILSQFVPICFAAFLVGQLVVDHNAHRLHRAIVSPEDSELRHIMVLSFLMVTGMCATMTLYTSIINFGTGSGFWRHYFFALARNYPVALLSQFLIVGPVVRRLHKRIFCPVKIAS